MKESRRIEEMAKLDGYFTSEHKRNGIPTGKMSWFHKNMLGAFSKPPHKYLNSHDDCQRVIDGLRCDAIGEFAVYLQKIIIPQATDYTDANVGFMLMATPAQKVEAILRATDKWEEGGDK